MKKLSRALMTSTLLLPFFSFKAVRTTDGAPWALAAFLASTLVVLGRFFLLFYRRTSREEIQRALREEESKRLWTPAHEQLRQSKVAILKLLCAGLFLLWVFIF